MFSTCPQANTTCSQYTGGRMYVANTLDKLSLLFQLTSLKVWVGLDDLQEEDNFRWADGKLMTSQERHELWYGNQPDNLNGEENCATVKDGNWSSLFNDQSCDYGFRPVCEIPIGG